MQQRPHPSPEALGHAVQRGHRRAEEHHPRRPHTPRQHHGSIVRGGGHGGVGRGHERGAVLEPAKVSQGRRHPEPFEHTLARLGQGRVVDAPAQQRSERRAGIAVGRAQQDHVPLDERHPRRDAREVRRGQRRDGDHPQRTSPPPQPQREGAVVVVRERAGATIGLREERPEPRAGPHRDGVVTIRGAPDQRVTRVGAGVAVERLAVVHVDRDQVVEIEVHAVEPVDGVGEGAAEGVEVGVQHRVEGLGESRGGAFFIERPRQREGLPHAQPFPSATVVAQRDRPSQPRPGRLGELPFGLGVLPRAHRVRPRGVGRVQGDERPGLGGSQEVTGPHHHVHAHAVGHALQGPAPHGPRAPGAQAMPREPHGVEARAHVFRPGAGERESPGGESLQTPRGVGEARLHPRAQGGIPRRPAHQRHRGGVGEKERVEEFLRVGGRVEASDEGGERGAGEAQRV